MKFGSVEFFKVLIKTVLGVLFFVPLILAIVFGVLFAQKNSQYKSLSEENSAVMQENDKLSIMADVLVGEKVGSAQDMREIINKSGVSYTELLALAAAKKDIDANGLYDVLSNAGVSDKDIIAMAAAKNTVGAEEIIEIMNNNGITPTALVKTVLQKNVTKPEDIYNILSGCGLSDEEIIEFVNSKGGSQSGTQSSSSGSGSSSGSESSSSPEEDSPYAELYPDMYVTAPADYNYEEGTIYFTFDDGPSKYTYSILGYLADYNVKATWFVVPSREEWCTEALRAIAAAGHTIGVHSYTHDYEKIYASVEAFLEDYHEAWSIVREATGQTPQIFRFAGGSKNDFNEDTRDAIIKEMTRRGFRYYDWNVESGDVNGATWNDMYNSIPRDCHALKRPVVLMHDSAGTPNAVLVLEDVLRVLVNEGYKFDSIHDDTEPVQFIGPFA